MSSPSLAAILEAALFVAGEPLSLERLQQLFAEPDRPDRATLRRQLQQLQQAATTRGVELVEVATGWRYQSRAELAPWLSRLWEERPPRYSRALLETLALIAYRQPITRAEIETIRGVAVSSQIMRTLQERGWIRIIGHREVPGRPGLYATTRAFLDHFNLQSLDQLPALAELRDLEQFDAEVERRLTQRHLSPGESETDEQAT